MPGIVMHHHFGKVVYSALPDEVKKAIYNIDLYDFATTGPDAFSYINFLNSKVQKENKAFSNYMHIHRTKEFFVKMVEISRVDYNVFNYLCGFVTHYYFDTFANPYIYYKTGVYDESDPSTVMYRGLNEKLKKAMDCYAIEHYYDSKPKSFNIRRKLLKLKKISKTSKESLDRLYSIVYGKNDGYKYVNSAIKWQRRYYRLILDRFGLKHRFLCKRDDGISEVDLTQISYFDKTINHNDIDIFNFKRYMWSNPVDKEMRHDESFFELLDIAKKLSVDCINALYRYVFGNESFEFDYYFKDLSYLTGIPCSYDLEMKYFDNIF